MALGLAPRLNGVNPGFGLPVLINGFMTGGWRISLLQLICVLIGCAIWYPFFRIADKQAYQKELESVTEEDPSKALAVKGEQ
jgi:PTS system cellobiose-specific IIC component